MIIVLYLSFTYPLSFCDPILYLSFLGFQLSYPFPFFLVAASSANNIEIACNLLPRGNGVLEEVKVLHNKQVFKVSRRSRQGQSLVKLLDNEQLFRASRRSSTSTINSSSRSVSSRAGLRQTAKGQSKVPVEGVSYSLTDRFIPVEPVNRATILGHPVFKLGYVLDRVSDPDPQDPHVFSLPGSA